MISRYSDDTLTNLLKQTCQNGGGQVGWWLACLLGTGIAVFLLWGKRPGALAWPEAGLIALGLIVSAGPMINEFEFGPNGWKLKTHVQAAADLAQKNADLTADLNKRLVELNKRVDLLSATTDALKTTVPDPAARNKVEAVAKTPPEPSQQEKAAQEATKQIQREIDSILKSNPKLFKF